MKASVDIALMNTHELELYADPYGETFVRAHAKADGAPRIAGYLGKSDAFDVASGKYTYADKVRLEAGRNRVPTPIFLMLEGIAMVAIGFSAYGAQ